MDFCAGDFQPGRSDLDLAPLTGAAPTRAGTGTASLEKGSALISVAPL
jgi:hypothetical protein